MTNLNLAQLINEKLGVRIYNEFKSRNDNLILEKYNDREIKTLQIDDLINRGYPTPRLIELGHEILLDSEEGLND